MGGARSDRSPVCSGSHPGGAYKAQDKRRALPPSSSPQLTGAVPPVPHLLERFRHHSNRDFLNSMHDQVSSHIKFYSWRLECPTRGARSRGTLSTYKRQVTRLLSPPGCVRNIRLDSPPLPTQFDFCPLFLHIRKRNRPRGVAGSVCFCKMESNPHARRRPNKLALSMPRPAKPPKDAARLRPDCGRLSEERSPSADLPAQGPGATESGRPPVVYGPHRPAHPRVVRGGGRPRRPDDRVDDRSGQFVRQQPPAPTCRTHGPRGPAPPSRARPRTITRRRSSRPRGQPPRRPPPPS